MQLTAEQVNEFLAKAVLESQIGDAVKTAVQQSLATLSSSYNNPFKAVVEREIVALIETEIRTTHREALQAKVREAVAAQATEEILDNILRAALEKVWGR